MNHLTVEENNVVERYLLGQLPAEEMARFEEHYLDCTECLDQLELSKRLHQGLKDVAAEDGTRLARTAVLAWLARRGGLQRAMFAVALLAVTALPWALLAPEVSRLAGERERLVGELTTALAPQVRTPTYFLSPERSGPGEEPSTRVTLGPGPEWVVLTLQPPPSADLARYRVRLREGETEPLWQSGPLEGDGSGQVTFSVHSSWFTATDVTATDATAATEYVVELDVVTSAGEFRPLGRFAFQVRREPSSH